MASRRRERRDLNPVGTEVRALSTCPAPSHLCRGAMPFHAPLWSQHTSTMACRVPAPPHSTHHGLPGDQGVCSRVHRPLSCTIMPRVTAFVPQQLKGCKQFVINLHESQIMVFLALSRDELPVSFKVLIGGDPWKGSRAAWALLGTALGY